MFQIPANVPADTIFNAGADLNPLVGIIFFLSTALVIAGYFFYDNNKERVRYLLDGPRRNRAKNHLLLGKINLIVNATLAILCLLTANIFQIVTENNDKDMFQEWVATNHAHLTDQAADLWNGKTITHEGIVYALVEGEDNQRILLSND